MTPDEELTARLAQQAETTRKQEKVARIFAMICMALLITLMILGAIDVARWIIN